VNKKQEYLLQLRETTAYPKYRLVVTILTIIGYIVCGFFAIGSLIAVFKGGAAGVASGLGGLLLAALGIFILIPFHRDLMLMGSDLVDAILDKNSNGGGGGGGAV